MGWPLLIGDRLRSGIEWPGSRTALGIVFPLTVGDGLAAMRSKLKPGLWFLSLILLGCAETEPLPSFVVDSAGVRIVQHGTSAEPSHVLTLADEPDYHVGWGTGDPSFERVIAGVILTDGRAAVGDYGSKTILVLSPTGEVQEVLGGPGEGPGEIGTVRSVHRIGQDTIAVEDGRNARITLFHEGSILRTVLTNRHGSTVPRMIAIGVDEGGLIMQSATYNPDFPELWRQGVIARFDLTSGRLDTLRTFDWTQSATTRRGIRFPVTGVTGTTKDAILIARSDLPQVNRINPEGELTQILRFPWERELISDSTWAAYEEYFMEEPVSTINASTRRRLFAQFKPPIGKPLPYFGTIRGDDLGNVWVGNYSVDYRTTGRYEVFSPTGDWLGSVSLPPRFRVLDIRERRILGVQYNDLGVNAVALFRIEW